MLGAPAAGGFGAPLRVGPNAAEDGFGVVSPCGGRVMFQYCGVALTRVTVACGVRVAFRLEHGVDRDDTGTVGTAPIGAAKNRDFGDWDGAGGVYTDGTRVCGGFTFDDVAPNFGVVTEGEVVVLEGLPDGEACAWVRGEKVHQWRVNVGDFFAVSGINGMVWRLEPAPLACADAVDSGAGGGEAAADAGTQSAAQSAAGPTTESQPSEPSQDLVEAASKGMVAEVRRFIADGADMRHPRLMCAAAGFGQVKVVKVLLEAGADKDRSYSRGFTPIHCAARAGKMKVVKLLIEAGADVDPRNMDNATPLHEAAHAGHEKVVQVLCEAGADKDAYTCPALHIGERVSEWSPISQYDGKTPLHMGLKHPKVINVLLKTGARDEAQSVNCCAALPGKTPLELATTSGNAAYAIFPKKSVTLLKKASQARATPAALSTAAPSDPPSNGGGSSSSSGDGAGSSGGGAAEETNAATDEKGNGAESKTNKRKRA